MSLRSLFSKPVGRRFVLAAALAAIATAAGLVILWPSDVPETTGPIGETERAAVVAISAPPCPPPQEGSCIEADVKLETGPDEGETTTLSVGSSGPQTPDLQLGDEIRVLASVPPPAGTVPGGDQAPVVPAYSFSDFERRAPMLWLAIAFAVLVIAFGRLRGALSLAGLAISLAIVLAFIVPSILDGNSPIAVAVVGGMAVMLVTIALAHGLGPKSLAAMLGTGFSLLLVAALAAGFTELTHLTGLASEEAVLLRFQGVAVDFQGLLLAGMVIGALGVLDDVTVSQASTAMALRAANPALRIREVYSRALVVGRDHVSATVNTLVLAYVGTSLPVLLIFSARGIGLGDALNGEAVATEVVGTLVGSIGLIAAVPVTTLFAARLAVGLPSDRRAAVADHGHAH